MNRYKIKRIGLLNFWLYDEEEFYFHNGNLLLRGSNGSGKSVTMQSFIPLLFDGNKSSERLDSFGSRSRKIDDYLLMEGSNLEENTGYLYMELYNEEQNRYITIGLGLKAVKNKPTSSWGFSITNQRRIGHDFLLYKDRSLKVPLSKKELVASLGDGGIVTDTMKEYKRMVNELIFGFPNMDMYDEFINLLLQIRSPKLSNSYKPKDLTSILSNVLQPLSEEEIMPMSEAISQMNKSKEQIEELSEEQRALKSLENVYREYNERLLYQKAYAFDNKYQDKFELETFLKQLELDKKSLMDEITIGNQEKQNLEIKIAELQLKESQFNNQKLQEITEKIGQEEDILNRESNKLKVKILAEEKKKEYIIGLEHQQIKYQDQIEKTEVELHELAQNLTEIEEEINLDEMKFYTEEFCKDMIHFCMFDEWQHAIKDYQTMLNKLYDQLEKIHKIDLEIDQNKEKCDEIENLIKEIMKKISIQQERLLQSIEEYKLYLANYSRENEELKFTEELLKASYQIIDSFNEQTPYQLKDLIGKLVRDKMDQYYRINIEYKEQKSSKEQEKNKVMDEIEKLKAGKIFDSFLDMSDTESYLQEHEISYLPLYDAISFKDDIKPAIKNGIESALVSLGLINAFIVDPSKISQISKEQKGRYLVGKVTYSNNLSKYFNIHGTDVISHDVIYKVLQSISCDENDLFYIDETGKYQTSLLIGQSELTEAKYIGSNVRKQYIENCINILQEKLKKFDAEIGILEMAIQSNIKKIEVIQFEQSNLKKMNHIIDIISEMKHAEINLDYQKERQSENIQLHNLLEENKRQQQGQLIEYQKQYHGICDLSSVIQIKNDILYYIDVVSKLSKSQLNYIHQKEQCLSNEIILSQNNEELEEIRVEISEFDRMIRMSTMKIEQFHQLLDQDQLKKAKEELLHIQSKKKELIQKREILATDVIKKEKDFEYITKDLNEKKGLQTKTEQTLMILERILKKEYELHYLYQEDMSVLEISKRVLKEIKINRNITVDECYSKLVQAHFKVSTALSKFTPNFQQILEMTQDEFDFEIDEELEELIKSSKRNDITFKYSNQSVNLIEILTLIEQQLHEWNLLLKEEDRELFQEILIQNVGQSIRRRIYASEAWIKEIKKLMESMQTSSGLSFSLTWTNVDGETEDEVNTKEIVDILKKDPNLVTEIDNEKITKHFRSKIRRAEQNSGDNFYYNIIFEVLDYRKWFQFKLFFKKTGDAKRELTDKHFNKFSGGEKAIAMYIPLFSSIYAKYKSASEDALKIIALDEAFAGVDDENIKDAFRILDSLDLDYLLTSQILWGDYETVKALAISELNRPNNSNVVSVINYKWEGNRRVFVTNNDYETAECL